jgi:hypothetical protein
LFFGAYLMWDDGVLDVYGRTLGFWDLGNMLLIVGYDTLPPTHHHYRQVADQLTRIRAAALVIPRRIIVISLKLVLHVNHWNWIVHVSVWGSFLVYLGISSAVNLIYVIYPLFAAQYFAFCTYNRP